LNFFELDAPLDEGFACRYYLSVSHRDGLRPTDECVSGGPLGSLWLAYPFLINAERPG
jgi:hypothetical protein